MSQSWFYRGVESAQRTLGAAGPDLRSRAQAAARLLDELVASTAEAPWRACRPGCASCCRHPIGVTLPEALALRRAVQALTPALRAAIAAAVAADAVATAALPWARLAGRPCPLLHEDRCAVYGSRPLPCRAWTSSDAAACAAAVDGGAEVPLDRDAFCAGLGVASALAAAAPGGQRELRAALAALLAAPEQDAAAAFAPARLAGA